MANANGDRTAVLAPVQWTGEEQPEAIAAVEESLSAALLGDGIAMPTAEVRDQAARCTDSACARQAAGSATLVIVPTITFRDRVYRLTLEAISVTEGTVLAKTSEFCEICGVADIADVAAEKATELRPLVAALLRGRPTLEVNSTPTGATVLVDGERLGETPITLELEPGRHVVRIETHGRVAQERELLAVEGEQETLSVELPPRPRTVELGEPAGPTERRRPLVAAGATTLGLGLGLVVAGAPLVAIDGRQIKSRCSGENVDINGTCKFSHKTLAIGVPLLAVGAVLTSIGVGLLATAGKRNRRGAEAARIVPAGLGVHARF